ncbi:MAG: dephospho-CoA kinase [Saprospiraceae bacterium]
MLIVGLTGGIGSGKSTVAKIFNTIGIPIYNSDIEAKNLIHSNVELQKKLIAAFGEKTYINGSYNRAYIAEIVFQDKVKLKALNQIIHPYVFDDFDLWRQHQTSAYIIKESALLLDTVKQQTVHKVISVVAPEKIRIERVLQRDHTTIENVQARIKNQHSDEYLKMHSDFIINNYEPFKLIPQVITIHKQILQLCS